MLMRTLRKSLLLGASLLLAAGLVSAQDKKSYTLEKIRNLGAIYVGHREASIPFSYIDG